MSELVEMGIEGRRRVKEQLKKMRPFEYHQTSMSYIDNDSGVERFVGVPVQGGGELIATHALPPGSTYTASVDDQGKVGLYRLELAISPGTGKLEIAGSMEGVMKESINRAFAYLQGHGTAMGVGRQVERTDFYVEAIDLLANRVPCEAGIALVVAAYSAIKKVSVLPGLMVFGDLSTEGTIKPTGSLVEPLLVGMEKGARRALIPWENKQNFLEVSVDISERIDPVFYSDPMMAAQMASGWLAGISL